ncbi:MAG: SipW-dependent-type signal peptide-containing protein, partial [Haloferacaceae archaeon]
MPDDYDLSRRKLLGAAGSIGAAAALGGAGTMAIFRDEETYANNQLTAGTLDLKVGWEEHYSDWSDDENDGLGGNVTMGNDQPVGLPTQNSSLISVANNTDAQIFLNNTETQQYPNDTSTVGNGTFDDATGMNGCDVLPAGSEQSPVIIDLDDVKPGDFGEVTFAFAVCSNPGYLWLNGGLRKANENKTNEPEADDPDEESGTVELLDAVQTTLWYDDGDNLQEGGGGGGGDKLDVAFVLDDSGSVSGNKQDIEDGAKALVDIL